MSKAGELKGSRDFDSQQGKFRYIVIGAGDQSEAYDKAAAQAPAAYLGVPQSGASVADQGAGVFVVEFTYSNQAQGTATNPDQGETPGSGNVTPPQQAQQPIGMDFSFTTGGGTKRIYKSLKTVFKIGRNQAVAPSFNKLIGYNPKDGSVEGCEIHSPNPEFTVTQKFAGITLGYIARLLATTAKTNKQPFRGCDVGECLFLGADGSFQGSGGERLPWTIAGKFAYSPNWTDEQLNWDDGAIVLPAGTVKGWHHVWSIYEDTTDQAAGNTFQVARPKFVYVEQVYKEENFAVLGMG